MVFEPFKPKCPSKSINACLNLLNYVSRVWLRFAINSNHELLCYPRHGNFYVSQDKIRNSAASYLSLIFKMFYNIYILLSTLRVFEGEDVAVRSFLVARLVSLKKPLLSAPISHKFSLQVIKLFLSSALSAS